MQNDIPAANTEAAFEAWAKQIATETGFSLGEKLYSGTFYSKEFIRNIIYAGTWQGKPAVLKAYDDPRLSDEPQALEAFHRTGATGVLRAPDLFASHVESPKRGWLIMERLEGGSFFRSPLSMPEKKVFVELFLAYRRQFSQTPTRPLTLTEQLPASEYHRTRIAQWFRLAADKEEDRRMRGEPLLLDAGKFLPQYRSALRTIDREFADRKMEWCHGHFKPKELYRLPDGGYVLTDFAHSKMYPVGYELAFMVWADCLMMTDWQMPYESWKMGIDEWLEAFRSRRDDFGFDRIDDLLRASLLERCVGTVLADITASDRPRDELDGRLKLLLRFMDELLA